MTGIAKRIQSGQKLSNDDTSFRHASFYLFDLGFIIFGILILSRILFKGF